MSQTDLSSPSSKALVRSFTMIIVSEIGDKTFLIAAILAMRHLRLTVFLGAFLSLLLMSFLSASMGRILPTLIPREWTQWCAAALFLVFGTRMWIDARDMEKGIGKIQREMREVEDEIEDDKRVYEGRLPNVAISGSTFMPSKEKQKWDEMDGYSSTPKSDSWTNGVRNFSNLYFGPIFVQAFVLTFLGEWGDRSQIATMVLGAAHNIYLVTAGTVLGHSCCTALAVIGGRYISTKISVKHVTYVGSVLFLLFGITYLYEGFVTSTSANVNLSGNVAIPISV